MLFQSASTTRTFAIMALAAAATGGTYVGFFSCGGYIRREWLIISAISALTVAAIASSIAYRRNRMTVLALLAAVFSTYRVAIATAWLFYVEPSSFGNYVSEFMHALIAG